MNRSDMEGVFREVRGKDENAIAVKDDKTVEGVSDNVIHQSLEPRGHDEVLKMAKGLLKAVSQSSPFRMLPRWYAFLKSNLEKKVAA